MEQVRKERYRSPGDLSESGSCGPASK